MADPIRVEPRAAAPVTPAPSRPAPAAPAPADSVELRGGQGITMVSVGDSLTAGTQDGITVHDRQRMSYSQQLADAAGVPYSQPILTEEGIPMRIWVDGTFDENRFKEVEGKLTRAALPIAFYLRFFGIPRNLDRIYNTEGLGKRDPDTLDSPQNPQHNFAVAGYELRHAADVGSVSDYLRAIRNGSESYGGLGQEVPLVHSQLQNDTDDPRGSALDQAISKRPDVVLFWGGNNDALETVGGIVDDRTLTPILSQPWTYWEKNFITGRWGQKGTRDVMPGFYDSARNALERLRTETNAEVFVMNIPDVTVIPFLRNLGEPVGDLPFRVRTADGTDVTDLLESFVPPMGVRGRGKEGRTEFPAGSKVNLINLLGAVAASGALRTRADVEARLAALRQEGALFDEFQVLDAQEVREVSQRIGEFNALLRVYASGPRFHFMDMNSVLDEIKANGRDLKGQGEDVKVTATFTGARERGMDGIFSYDGVHPSDTGHAMIANVILDRMKRDLGGQEKFAFLNEVPEIDEKAVFRSDPHRQEGTFYLTPESVEAYRAAMRGVGIAT